MCLTKKLTSILFFLTFINLNYSHTERVHQYIVQESYKLLKLYLGNKDIPKMQANLGYKETGGFLSWVDRGSDYIDGTICAGAYREDVQDIVYGYGEAWGIPIADQTAQEWYASVTHFWEADQGDYALTNLDLTPNMQIPNAYMKMMRYYNSMWIGINQRVEATTVKGDNVLVFRLSGTSGGNFYYDNLINFYKTGKVYNNFAILKSLNSNREYYYDGDLYIKEPLRSKIVFEILGRMCHLLADMSVPAHVHNTTHIPKLSKDKYEQSFMNIEFNDESFNNPNITFWNANRVWNTFGSIVSPYVSFDNSLHYLMYTLNQITDHFANRTVNGDDIFNNNYSEITNNFPYGINPVTISQYNDDVSYSEEMIAIRDKTFPHAIRATAGLLYWFAKEAGILPIPITGARIEYLYNYEFKAIPENGFGPFTYRWEMLKDGTLLRAAPGNQWTQVGISSPTLQLYDPNNGDYRDFSVRCVITDNGSGISKTSNEIFIDVIPPSASVKNIETPVSQRLALEEGTTVSRVKLTNHPNPFNPATTINYSLKEKENIIIKVYNSIGQEVAELVNGDVEAGEHQAIFNASHLTSGIYYCRLISKDYNQTIKLILMK